MSDRIELFNNRNYGRTEEILASLNGITEVHHIVCINRKRSWWWFKEIKKRCPNFKVSREVDRHGIYSVRVER